MRLYYIKVGVSTFTYDCICLITVTSQNDDVHFIYIFLQNYYFHQI